MDLPEDKLKSFILKCLLEEISVGELETMLSEYYLYQMSNRDSLSPSEVTFFEEVLYKLSFTNTKNNPTDAERHDGWINQKEFVDWLKQMEKPGNFPATQ